MIYGGPAFIQIGALAALSQDLPEVAALRAAYQARADHLCGLLADAPNCRVIPPEGGMFVLLDIRGSGLGAEQFAQQLLERENVAVLPCDSFGPSAVGHLRISLTAPNYAPRRSRPADRPLCAAARPRPGAIQLGGRRSRRVLSS